MKRRSVLAAAVGACTTGWSQSRPFLVISGKLGNSNAGAEHHFTEGEFLALPQSTIVTATAWTPKSRWDGPRVDAVLKHVQAASGDRLRVSALDDYYITIPWEDIQRWGILLAHSRDGVRLGRNRWGPLFIIYPRDDYPRELNTPMTEAKFIWQVGRIDVE